MRLLLLCAVMTIGFVVAIPKPNKTRVKDDVGFLKVYSLLLLFVRLRVRTCQFMGFIWM